MISSESILIRPSSGNPLALVKGIVVSAAVMLADKVLALAEKLIPLVVVVRNGVMS